MWGGPAEHLVQRLQNHLTTWKHTVMTAIWHCTGLRACKITAAARRPAAAWRVGPDSLQLSTCGRGQSPTVVVGDQQQMGTHTTVRQKKGVWHCNDIEDATAQGLLLMLLGSHAAVLANRNHQWPPLNTIAHTQWAAQLPAGWRPALHKSHRVAWYWQRQPCPASSS